MITLRNIAAESMLGALAAEFGAGSYIQFYLGPRPAYPEMNILGATLLGRIDFATAPFQLPYTDNGVVSIDLESLPAPGIVINTGVTEWFRAFSEHDLAIIDGSVTTMAGDGDCKLLDTTLVVGQEINLQTWKITLPQ